MERSEIHENLRWALGSAKDVEWRPTEGGEAAYVGGVYACGLHNDAIIVNVKQSEREELLGYGATEAKDPPAPGAVVLPSGFSLDPDTLKVWARSAVANARGQAAASGAKAG